MLSLRFAAASLLRNTSGNAGPKVLYSKMNKDAPVGCILVSISKSIWVQYCSQTDFKNCLTEQEPQSIKAQLLYVLAITGQDPILIIPGLS